MKRIVKTQLTVIILISLFLLTSVSCNQSDKDKAVKADLTTKAKQEKDLIGVRFTVENGNVSLSGECPNDKAKAHVETIVKSVYGVKQVKNNIIIAPVIIGTDEAIKESADSVLKKYAGVNAIVKDSVVVLQGKVESKEAPKLLAAMQSLGAKKVENELYLK